MSIHQAMLGAALGVSASGAIAEPIGGVRDIALLDKTGGRIAIGAVDFAPDGTYRIRWNDGVFSDHFLSMRPFRCLEGPDKHWCHVPYPYEIERKAGPENLTDLEYDLLFVWKGATDYGINLWNGVYYRLSPEDGRITGRLYEMDLDVLSAPPEAGEKRPIKPKHLHEGDPSSHWLPGLVIE